MAPTTLTYLRALSIGFLTGIRTTAGPALVSYSASRGKMPNLEGSKLGLLANRKTANALALAALGETVADKLPGVPGRNTPPSVAGRMVSAAVAGSASNLAARQPALLGGALAALVAGLTSVGIYHLRTWATRRLGVPNVVGGLLEDALVATGALHVARR